MLIRLRMVLSLRSRELKTILNLIEMRLQGHTTVQLLCCELVQKTMYFFCEKSATMTSLYTMLVTKAYGQESKASKDAKAAC